MKIRDEHFPTNPSILAWEDGYLFNVRMIGNYGSYFYTYNILYRLTGDFEVLWSQRLDHGRENDTTHRGLEDVRLFIHKGKVMFLASEPHGRGKTFGIRVSLGLLSIEKESARLLWARPIESPKGDSQEKNWLPFSEGGEILVHYKCGLFGRLNISTFDRLPPRPLKISLEEVDHVRRDLRGGFLLPLEEGGYLGILHQMRGGVYRHCLFRLDSKKRLMSISPMFSFTKNPIEFVLSLAFRGEDLIIPYGVMDREYEVIILPKEMVERLLSAGVGL